MPMTRQALKDPKVRHELGEGGAPEEQSERLELLVEEYRQCAATLDKLGFHGKLLDIEVPVAKKFSIPESKEAQIDAIVANKGTIHRAGMLYRVGECVANSHVICEAHKRIEKKEQEDMMKKKNEKKAELDKKDWLAIGRFNAWKREGKPRDAAGNPKFSSAKHAMEILKALLPKIDPSDKVSQYNSGTKSLNRLLKMDDWEAEMEKVVEKTVPPKLFE